MKHLTFSKKHLAICISAIITSGFSQFSMAEEESTIKDDENLEIITVSGIRGSLIRSMNVKRDMSGVVDAISAEEMGKFPDTNLAESLQRITGVSVSRSNGEGSQITVRGFGPEFNLVTLNGRQMPGTGNTRSYSFENLSSDGVSALELYKTARAEMPTGGLGATVNIVTSKPLTNPGLQYSLSGKLMHDSSNVAGDNVTPEISAIVSNTFFDDTFGVSFSMTHHERDFQKQSANIQGWQANVALPDLDASQVVDNRLDPDGAYFFPRDMNYGIADIERERLNTHLTVQYQPMDELVLTVDYVTTDATTGSNSIGWGMWNDYGGNINSYELDENGTAVFADISGNDGSYTASRSTTKAEERSIGFNAQWQVSDTLSFELDYHDSESTTDNGADEGLGSDGSLVLGSDQLITKTYDFRSGDIPSSQIFWKNGTTELAPGEIDSHFSQFIHSPGKSEIQQLQLHGSWDNDVFDIPLATVNFGLAHSKQKMSGSNAWSGLIGGFLFNPSYTAMLPDGMFVRHSTDSFLDQFDGGGSALTPNYYYTFDFDEVVARSAAFLTNDVLGGDDYFATSAYHPLGTFSEGSVEEEVSSVYITSEWEFELAGYDVEVNLGVRYEQTDVTSQKFQDVPVAVWWKGGSEWLTQYDGDSFYDLGGDNDVLLPMLDIKVDITDDIVGRMSWGKTITRANLGDLGGGLSLSGSPKIGSRNGSRGNPNLLPFESSNLDLSLEYYYEEGSYVSLGYYNKEVANYIGFRSVNEQYENILDIYQGPRWNQAEADVIASGEQATNDAIFAQMQANGATLNELGFITPQSGDPVMTWNIREPFNNSETKSVDGFEFAMQHLFGETGFGIGFNATTVDGDTQYDVTDLTGDQSPLTGLSDSANFQAFYEKEGLSVKVTYAWRDKNLIGVGQSQGSSDNPPQYAKEYAQWDASVNYDIDEQFTVFFEGLNLTNETEQHYGRYEAQFLQANQYGPRYTVGIRYSFK